MPIPAFVVCSLSASEDVATKQVSLFHVVDTIKVKKRQDEENQPSALPVRVTAAWLAEPSQDSSEDDFQYEIVLRYVGQPDLVIGKGTFAFTKPIHRVTAFGLLGGFPGLGVLRFVSRVRKVRDTDWIEQAYPVLISETRKDATE